MPPRNRDEPPSSTILSRWIGRQLTQHREAAGFKVEQVADHLDMHFRTITKIEQGQYAPTLIVLRAMLDLYGVQDRQYRSDLEVLRRDAKNPGWSGSYLSSVQASARYAYMAYCDIEERATQIREASTTVVPGLLQTAEYAQVVQNLPTNSGLDAKALVALRMERQGRVLDRPEGAPDLSVVMDEAVLLRHLGYPDVMAAQIDHIVGLSESGRIALHVVPLDTRLMLPCEPFIILSTAIRAVAVITGIDQMPMFEQPHEVEGFEQRFQRCENAALSNTESVVLCKSVSLRHRRP